MTNNNVSKKSEVSKPRNRLFLVVADDMTTLLDDTTRDAVYLVDNITSCGNITIAAALS